MNLNQLTEKFMDIKSKIKAVQSQEKELKEELEEVQIQIMNMMSDQGLNRLATDSGSFSLGKDVVYNIVDPDAFQEFVIGKGDIGYLQRRPSKTYIAEALQTGEVIPGIQPYELDKLNYRTN